MSDFDPRYGDWYFFVTDKNEYPPGEYTFLITGTVGDQSDFYELVFNLVDPCTEATFTVLQSPFYDAVYQLSDPDLVQPWIDSELFNVDTPESDPSLCGDIQVDFIDADTEWYFDFEFFSQDNNEFRVLETSDPSWNGDYNVFFWIYFIDYPDDAYVQSPESFKIKITDVNCDLVTLTASSLE